MFRKAMLATVICFATSGCGSVFEAMPMGSLERGAVPTGVRYSLPRELRTVTLTHGLLPVVTAEGVRKIAAYERTIAIKRAQLAAEKEAALKANLTQEIKDLSEAKAAVIRNSPTTWALDLAISAPVVIRDPDHSYILSYSHSLMSDDTIAIETDDLGYLKKVSTTTKDQTGAVISKAVKLTTDAIVFAGSGGFSGEKQSDAMKSQNYGAKPARPPIDPCLRPFTVSVTIDPSRPVLAQGQLRKAVQDTVLSSLEKDPAMAEHLSDASECVNVKVFDGALNPTFGASSAEDAPRGLKDPNPARAKPAESARPSPEEQRERCTRSACYWRPGDAVFEFSHRSPGTRPISAVFTAPQLGEIAAIDFTRRAFVEATAEATFNAGSLTSVSYSDPSEALGFLAIPSDVLGHVFGIPSRLWETQTGRVKAQKDLVDARAGLLESNATLLKQQLELQRLGDESVAPTE